MAPILIGTENFPGAAVQTDAQILDTIRKTFTTVFHASCTCKMGQAKDPAAVVDSKARVFGVKGLRVVDAASFALLPPGHPVSTVCKSKYSPLTCRRILTICADALAEKIAADILSAN
jgi:choline dehydrogenase